MYIYIKFICTQPKYKELFSFPVPQLYISVTPGELLLFELGVKRIRPIVLGCGSLHWNLNTNRYANMLPVPHQRRLWRVSYSTIGPSAAALRIL